MRAGEKGNKSWLVHHASPPSASTKGLSKNWVRFAKSLTNRAGSFQAQLPSALRVQTLMCAQGLLGAPARGHNHTQHPVMPHLLQYQGFMT